MALDPVVFAVLHPAAARRTVGALAIFLSDTRSIV
jgi:hypothetical protein